MAAAFPAPSYNYLRAPTPQGCRIPRWNHAPFVARPALEAAAPRLPRYAAHSSDDAEAWYQEDAASGEDLMQILRQRRPGEYAGAEPATSLLA